MYISSMQVLRLETKSCKKTVKLYIKIANVTYVWRNLPNFEKSIIKMLKGYIIDSGLLHYILRL